MFITFVIILIILVIVFFVSLHFDTYKDFCPHLLFMIILFSIGIGLFIEDTYTVKKPLIPSIEIKCTDGKCDTSYVYKLK